MYNREPMKWQDLALAFLTFLVGVAMGAWSMTTPTVMDTPAIPRPAQFQVHKCFHRDGKREPWETSLPDGIIEQVGYEHYLVMFQSEAEKRGGGDKVSLPLTIESFDATHHEVACPPAWLNHNRRR